MAMGIALAVALVVGGMAPGVAWAAGENGTGTGNVTIARSDGNTVTGYEAIKIFSADVTNNGTDTQPNCIAVGLTWASDDVKTAVLKAIQEYCTAHSITYDATKYTDPQNAADFMVTYINGGNYQAIVTPDSFANVLANKLAGAVIEGKTVNAESLTAGVQKELTEGYYLVISTPAELGTATSASATSPILMLLAEGQNLSITEKVTIPTLKKTVVEDSATDTETSFADAQVGQELQFTLTGTVAGNVAGFTNYYYKFTDVLPKGMDLKMAGDTIAVSDVVVKVDNTKSTTNAKTTYTITSGYTVDYTTDATAGTKTLTVEFEDLKSANVKGKTSADAEETTVPIDSASVVTVTYKAALNADAVAGLTNGNVNTATLTYNTYPNRKDQGTTTRVSAKVYEYALKLEKVDKSHELDADPNTNTKLSGAKFTIQATATDEGTANNGKYLKTDGTFGATTQPAATATDYIFTTGTDGSFTVKGLDAGTYVIHEVTPPQNYKALAADLQLVLTVNKDNRTLEPAGSVSATLSGGEGDGLNTTQDQTAPPNKGTRASFDSSTGTVTIVATNQKEEQLPITGLPGITMVYVVGGAILVASLTVIVRRRVRERE